MRLTIKVIVSIFVLPLFIVLFIVPVGYIYYPNQPPSVDMNSARGGAISMWLSTLILIWISRVDLSTK